MSVLTAEQRAEATKWVESGEVASQATGESSGDAGSGSAGTGDSGGTDQPDTTPLASEEDGAAKTPTQDGAPEQPAAADQPGTGGTDAAASLKGSDKGAERRIKELLWKRREQDRKLAEYEGRLAAYEKLVGQAPQSQQSAPPAKEPDWFDALMAEAGGKQPGQDQGQGQQPQFTREALEKAFSGYLKPYADRLGKVEYGFGGNQLDAEVAAARHSHPAYQDEKAASLIWACIADKPHLKADEIAAAIPKFFEDMAPTFGYVKAPVASQAPTQQPVPTAPGTQAAPPVKPKPQMTAPPRLPFQGGAASEETDIGEVGEIHSVRDGAQKARKWFGL